METVILIGSILLKYGPAVAEAFQKLLAKKDPPTQAEWDSIFELSKKSYDEYIAGE